MRRLGAVLLCLSLSLALPAAQSNDRADVAAVVDGFYGAMKRGDVAGVMRAVAPDAVFLEGGRQETRAEYEAGHLPGDIEFERVVNSKRGPLAITINGDTAWAVGMADYEGSFKGKPVTFVLAQLMILTRSNGQWLIRGVHWSSRSR
jgi:ketosteroid isomerase-like protein